ncbi:MAG TPA: glycosyltransferase family 9 protein [Rhodopila sp.]|nr:glycosyltransferase family 9 protein [Rhodopila sp.]
MTRKTPASTQKQAAPRKRAARRGAGTVAAEAGGSSAVALSEGGGAAGGGAAGGGAPVVAPVILIEIDPGVSGGHARGRFDIMIRGRAVSTAVIEEIRLQVDDLVASSASFGPTDHTPAVVLPDGTILRQRGFHFSLPRPGEGAADRCRFRIVARTAGGFEHAESFEIDVDPVESAVSVVAGPTDVTAGFVRPYAVLYIERATIDADGVLVVDGWAVSQGPTLAVQVFADATRVGQARCGTERGDVGAAFPAYPNAPLSGFSLSLQLDEADRGLRWVRAQIVCPHGFGHAESVPVERLVRRAPQDILEGAASGGALPGRLSGDGRMEESLSAPDGDRGALAGDAPAPAREGAQAGIRLHCDSATLTTDGVLSVDGWAVCSVGILQVRVLLDGEEAGLASLGHERDDVGAIFPRIPTAAMAGFRFERRVRDAFEGEHQVRIIARSMRDGTQELELPVIAAEPVVPALESAGAAEGPDMTAEQNREFRFELDGPPVANGVAVAVVTGRLTIEGWLLTRSGIAGFEVFLDDQRLGEMHYGLARQDVGGAFPEWPNAVRSGFAFHCPPRSLRDGEHTVELRIRANNGVELTRSFSITVKKSGEQADSAGIRRRVPLVETNMMAGLLADMAFRPSFQFILRQDRPVAIAAVRTTLDGLRRQAYGDWTALVLAGDDAIAAEMRDAIEAWLPHLAERFTVISPSDAAWTAPLGHAAGAGPTVLHALLLPGDEPAADALLELAVASSRHPDCDLLYADEVRISPVSQEPEAFFKPDFSPDLLLSTNYIGRPFVVTGALLARTGATPAGLLADGEYDLVLRCAELARGVHHVPRLLCQRALVALDDPETERAALERVLERRGIEGVVVPTPIAGTWRVRRAGGARGKVSIIIPTCAAQGYIETCIQTLREKTAYRDFEIICIDNIRPSDIAWKIWLQQNADKVVEIPEAFNWSVFNNRAAEVAEGEYLLFLNDDIEIIRDDWLDAMLEHASRPEVGITGPQLLYRDGKVQHAGMFLATNGIGRHAFRFAAADDPCYFGLALTQRNVIAVTGACMLVRRDTFERLGRFDEAHEIVNNDLDFCLRAHRAGLLTVYTPYATLIHYELASRANLQDVYDLSHFNAAWQTMFAAGDPYFNPRLSRHADDYRPDDEPVQWVVAGAPLFAPEEIKRILVVKLDHIGDFITALPAIRRLKALFPAARITVLAGPASRSLAALEPAIDEFIPFAFFHARSQLGERALATEDYAELARQLRPYRFDLAVDLRKHLSTRDVLKHAGARFLAGFDYLGQFPYLDIALDWDGDRTLQRKRSHVVDDLMALVAAIGHAAETERGLVQPAPAALSLDGLPAAVRALFGKKVVAIHPGAGNVTKQWPEAHFVALIALLIERNDVNILLVGGADEVETANTLLAEVARPGVIASLAGQTSLADLPRLLKNCVLYIGNDSGPKHIAAAVGIPTIGIHSGVVDPVEWGPVGPQAVALRRNMTCSPCYLANAEDCPRALACLQFLEPNLVYETADLLLRRSAPAAPQAVDEQEIVVTVEAERGQPATEPA